MVQSFSIFTHLSRSIVIVPFVVLTTWWCVFSVLPWHEPYTNCALFSIVATTLHTLLYHSLIRDWRLRVLPRFVDSLTFVGLAPVAAIAGELCVRLFGEETITTLSIIGILSMGVALLAFILFYSGALVCLTLGFKRKIILDINPAEELALRQALSNRGIINQVELLQTSTLRESILAKKTSSIDLVVTSDNTALGMGSEGILIRAHLAGVPIYEVQEITNRLWGKVAVQGINHVHFLVNAQDQNILRRVYQLLKSLIEPVIALAVGIALLPLFVVVGILIKLDSKGPVFFTQVRSGYLGKLIRVVKFRSMITDAEKEGPRWAADNDDRITKLGKFLRKTRIDELPQLWNVMRGDMGFVGPRPERPEFYNKIKEQIPLFTLRTLVKPGITGWAQVYAGYAASIDESRVKLEYDLFYIQNMTPRTDLIVLAKTITVALMGEERNAVQEQIISQQQKQETVILAEKM
jgi:lipopolysaccharide/colanic/teichoic acid biosynthesis glycosyltransferase